MEERPGEKEVMGTIVVENLAHERPSSQHEEDLKRRNPSDIRWRVLSKLMCLVIVLEDTDAIDPTEGYKQAC